MKIVSYPLLRDCNAQNTSKQAAFAAGKSGRSEIRLWASTHRSCHDIFSFMGNAPDWGLCPRACDRLFWGCASALIEESRVLSPGANFGVESRIPDIDGSVMGILRAALITRAAQDALGYSITESFSVDDLGGRRDNVVVVDWMSILRSATEDKESLAYRMLRADDDEMHEIVESWLPRLPELPSLGDAPAVRQGEWVPRSDAKELASESNESNPGAEEGTGVQQERGRASIPVIGGEIEGEVSGGGILESVVADMRSAGNKEPQYTWDSPPPGGKNTWYGGG